MAIKDKIYLKSRFENGDNPLQDDFIDLIDSMPHINDVKVDGGAYDTTLWDGNGDAPTKNAVRDKFVLIETSIAGKSDVGHTHTATQITDFNSAVDGRISVQKGASNGIASLDSSGKIPNSQLPAFAISQVYIVSSQAQMIALTAQEGDVAVRTDLNKSFIHNSGTSGTVSDWQELLTPTDAVLSVNGQTGNVSLTSSDISEGSNLYYTNARFDTRLATKTTDNLNEGGSNLYYSDTRFDARFTAKNTDNLSEGSLNLYYTNARFDNRFAGKTSDDLAEGTSNLFFTNSRADARITAQKGVAGGIATLDSVSGKIPSSQLPALAITETFVVASQSAQLALTAQEGDVAVRTDQNKSYIHNAGTTGTMSDWQELLTPTDAVLSVNGQTGTVSLSTSDIAEGSNLYFTVARVLSSAISGLNSALTGNIANADTILQALGKTANHIGSTANPHNVTKSQVGLGNVDNVQQLPLSYLDVDASLVANSDLKVPSQKAIKAYVDAKKLREIYQFSLTGQASNAIGLLSKGSSLPAGGGGPSNNVNPSGMPSTSAANPGISAGGVDPYIIYKDSIVKEIRITVAQASVSVASASSGVTMRFDLYKLGYNSRTLVANLDVPLDYTKVSGSNSLANNNFQTAVLSGLNLSISAGDMIGIEFTNRSGSATTINAAGRIFASLETHEV
jgi:hypothetical protein